jgi:hypothetical protein
VARGGVARGGVAREGVAREDGQRGQWGQLSEQTFIKGDGGGRIYEDVGGQRGDTGGCDVLSASSSSAVQSQQILEGQQVSGRSLEGQ